MTHNTPSPGHEASPSAGRAVAARDLTHAAWKHIVEGLCGLRYGLVTIRLLEGLMVKLERFERKRF
jgi:hypothetical protein